VAGNLGVQVWITGSSISITIFMPDHSCLLRVDLLVDIFTIAIDSESGSSPLAPRQCTAIVDHPSEKPSIAQYEWILEPLGHCMPLFPSRVDWAHRYCSSQ
jgi:hypothetical protein